MWTPEYFYVDVGLMWLQRRFSKTHLPIVFFSSNQISTLSKGFVMNNDVQFPQLLTHRQPVLVLSHLAELFARRYTYTSRSLDIYSCVCHTRTLPESCSEWSFTQLLSEVYTFAIRKKGLLRLYCLLSQQLLLPLLTFNGQIKRTMESLLRSKNL